MAYSRRSYKGAPVTNALSGSTLAANATSINLASAMSGWSTSGTPFFIVVDPGTSKEEKICVVYNTSTSLTVVDPAVTSGWTASVNGRGCDDTTDRAHDAGAVVYPVFTALEANQANELVSKYTTNGDIVVHGSTGLKTVATGGSGNNNKVLIADSTVTDGGVKWGQVDTDSIANDAVTTAKIDANAVGLSELATAVINKLVPVGTIAMYGGATAPTGWLLCNGDAIDAGYTALKAIVGNNTPDLKGRFAIGDNSSLSLLGTGGSATIGEANLPVHHHTINHNHPSATTGGQSQSHSHGYTATVFGSSFIIDPYDITGSILDYQSTQATGDASQDHTHTFDVPDFTGTSGSTGSGTDYYPPYLVVNYIIKHD